jgi:uncharacterized membrane protein YbaN (DUF454 family)
LSIFETIGIVYTILATTLFTVQLVYCSAKGLNNLRHLLARGSGGEERRKSAERNKTNFFKLEK